jgi:chromosome segregation ATPase
MAIFASKRLKNLRQENEKLKAQIIKTSEKEETAKHLENVLLNIRKEMTGLQNAKTEYTLSINQLKKIESSSKDEVEKLNLEISRLREMKNEEQNNLLEITNRIHELVQDNHEGNGRSITSVISTPAILEEIKSAEQKRNELSRENNELEEKQKELYLRIVELTQKEKNLLSNIDEKRRQIESGESNVNTLAKETNERILSLVAEEQNLLDSIDKKKEKVNRLLAMITTLEVEKRAKFEEIKNKIKALKNEEESLLDKIKPVKAYASQTEMNRFWVTIQTLKQEERHLKERVDQLRYAEEIKRNQLSELNDNLSAKEIEFASLEQDFITRTNQVNQVAIRNRELAEENDFQNKKLSKINDSITAKTMKLDELNTHIMNLEEKINLLNIEISRREIMRSDIVERITKEKENGKKLEEYYKKLRETIPALEKRKEEIYNNNKLFEDRFTGIFQKYSKELNEISQKKNLIEQMLLKKEEDLNEKDQLLLEKTMALEETEKILQLRETEIDSYDDLLKLINEQKEFLKNDLITLDEQTIEKRNRNRQLQIETEVLQTKATEFEKELNELFSKSQERFNNNQERREKLVSEIREYEYRMKELNDNIKDSMNELVEQRSSLRLIKLEHEEHRLEINKLVTLKKRLQEEVDKNQIVLNKYRKIRERIKQQEVVRNRDVANPGKDLSINTDEKGISETNIPKERESLAKVFKL